MTRRFTLALLATARDCGLEGARIRHTGRGPRLVGCVSGQRVSLPFPGTTGVGANRAACSALRKAFAGGGATDPVVLPFPAAACASLRSRRGQVRSATKTSHQRAAPTRKEGITDGGRLAAAFYRRPRAALSSSPRGAATPRTARLQT
jgi:hypothetical protein